jgi:Tfp pilus assembly protein PilE
MRTLNRGRRQEGVSFIECLVVLGAIAILLTLGIFAHRHLRQQARVSLAESRLRQVATGFDLYFNKYKSYPPQGANLAEALAEFIDSESCLNALADETTDGETISLLYREPSLRMLDRPNEYLTAMVADDGRVAVVLLSGSKVVSEWDIDAQAPDYASVMATLLARLEPEDSGGGGSTTGALDGIKYIVVKSDSGLVYQGTSKRLAGKKAGQRQCTDTFTMAVTDEQGNRVEPQTLRAAAVHLSVHDANKNKFKLLDTEDWEPGDPERHFVYGDLLGAPVELVHEDDGEPAGLSVKFHHDESAGLVVRVTMGMNAQEDVFHSLTRIWIEFEGLKLTVTGDADGNKYFATRYPDSAPPSWWE